MIDRMPALLSKTSENPAQSHSHLGYTPLAGKAAERRIAVVSHARPGVATGPPRSRADSRSTRVLESGVMRDADDQVTSLLASQYQSTYCLPAYFTIFGHPVSHYAVVGTDAAVDDIVVFFHEGTQVMVANSACRIRASSLAAFRDWLFAGSTSGSIHVSMFSLEGGPPARSLCRRLSNDAVIELPARADEYLSHLGAKTRQHVRNHRRKLAKEWPDVQFAVVSGSAVPTSTILAIIELNRRRMAAKGVVSGYDEEYALRLVRLMRECGLVATATVGERIVAGALLTHVEQDYFLHTTAHDEEFNQFSLGILCLVHAIEEVIGRGAERLHMLWGQSDYKTRLGAVDTVLYSLVLYRHRRSVLAGRLRGLLGKAARRAGLSVS